MHHQRTSRTQNPETQFQEAQAVFMIHKGDKEIGSEATDFEVGRQRKKRTRGDHGGDFEKCGSPCDKGIRGDVNVFLFEIAANDADSFGCRLLVVNVDERSNEIGIDPAVLIKSYRPFIPVFLSAGHPLVESLADPEVLVVTNYFCVAEIL